MRRNLLVAIGVSLLLLVPACSGSNGEIDGPVLRVGHRREVSVMTALIGGRLELDATTGCLELSGSPAVWPPGTTWRADPPAVVTSEGRMIAVGDTISAGGGAIDPSHLDSYAGADLVPAVERCLAGGGQILLVQTEPLEDPPA